MLNTNKILFIHQPGDGNYGAGVQLLPVGLIALADFVMRNNIEVQIIHIGLEKKLDPNFDICEYIIDENIDIVCIGLHWHWQTKNVFKLASKIKKANEETKIILGGFTATYFAREIMEKEKSVDFIIQGDAELPLLFLIRELAHVKSNFFGVTNLLWRDNAELRANPHDYIIDQELIDNLRYTNFSLIKNYEKYLSLVSLSFSQAGKESTFYYAPGRGCSVNCSFCGGSLSAQIRLNRREKPIFISSTSVIRDLENLKFFNINRIYFAFDPYPDNDYYPKLFQSIKQARLDMSLDFESFGLPSDDFVYEFKQSFGSDSSIFISPYSGSEEVRRNNRGIYFSNEEFYNTLDNLKQNNIKTMVGFSAGLSREGGKEALESLEMIKRIKNDYKEVEIAIEGVAMEPGAPWHIDQEEYGIQCTRKSLDDFINESPGSIGYDSKLFSEEEINEILNLYRIERDCKMEKSKIYEYLQKENTLPQEFKLAEISDKCNTCRYYDECFKRKSRHNIKAEQDGQKEKDIIKNDCILLFPPVGFQFSMPEIGLPQLSAYLNSQNINTQALDLNSEFIYKFIPKNSEQVKKRVKERFDPHWNRAIEAFDSSVFLDIDHQNIERSKNGTLRDHGFDYLNILLSVNFLEYNIDKVVEMAIDGTDDMFNVYYKKYVKNKVADIGIIGFSILTAQQLSATLYLARKIKEDWPDKKIVLGGPWCTSTGDFFDDFKQIFNLVDYIVVGEGEIAMTKLINKLKNKENDFDISGLMFMDNDKLKKGLKAETYILDDLPVPDYSQFVRGKVNNFPLLTTKECYWSRCKFCHHQSGEQSRQKSETKTCDEMEEINNKYAPEMIELADSATPINLLDEVSEEIIRRKINVKWTLMARAGKELNKEVLLKLKKAGCQNLSIGLECADQKNLDKLQKGIDLRILDRIINNAHSISIGINLFVMAFPGQNRELYKKTWEYVLERFSKIDNAYAQYFQMGRNAKMFRDIQKYGISLLGNCKKDIRSFDLPCVIENTIEFDKFIEITLDYWNRFNSKKINENILQRIKQDDPKTYLLVRPPFVQVLSRDDEKYIHGYSEPVGLLKIGSFLKKQGHRVELIDCIAGIDTDSNDSLHFYKSLPCGNKKDGLNKKVYWAGISIGGFEDILKKLNSIDEVFISTFLLMSMNLYAI